MCESCLDLIQTFFFFKGEARQRTGKLNSGYVFGVTKGITVIFLDVIMELWSCFFFFGKEVVNLLEILKDIIGCLIFTSY